MQIGRLQLQPLTALLAFVPLAGVAALLHASPPWMFATAALAIIPLAGLMGRATESLSERLGPGPGGLLNASFGNAAELIIAVAALQRGLHDVVKASITGSIIGNVLLVLGLASLAGGVRFERLRFNATAASAGATLLVLSAIALVVPAIFHRMVEGRPNAHEKELSLEISIVLFVTYILSLLFSLRTHRHLYSGPLTNGGTHGPGWSTRRSVVVLLVATGLVALLSEALVGSVEHTAEAFDMTEVFVGVIVVAIIGNAAEHSTAVLVAMKDRMDLAMNIAVGSSIQVALFVAPVLVFSSYAFGSPLDLVFTTFEVAAVVASVAVLALVAQDGEVNWLEGAQLLAVYFILALAFFFLPA